MSEAITRGVQITVRSRFHPEHSDTAIWFFSYTVQIANVGAEVVQLQSRHWVITDGMGRVEHVRGPGVVGETPTLAPGEAFEYTSFCPLPTQVGAMEGSYRMRTTDGEEFDALVAPFGLVDPAVVN